MTLFDIGEVNPICRRTYIRIEGILDSPLSIGSGEGIATDTDVILDAQGNPFVPGSSLAGAMRHYFAQQVKASNHSINGLFGSIETNKQSSLFIYDMQLLDAKQSLSKRDGVKLDFFKTAMDKAKYEIQIIERGVEYVIRFELVERSDDLRSNPAMRTDLVRQAIDGLASGEITLGAKSHRGFGKLAVKTVQAKVFDYTKTQDCLEWLDWDDQEGNAFDNAEQWSFNQEGITAYTLKVPLKIRQSIMIRQYAIRHYNTKQAPDYEHLYSGGEAVIPGTSWMGAIRSRLSSLLLQEFKVVPARIEVLLEPILGTVINGDSTSITLIASTVRVEESVIEGGHALTMTRTAIDRFTGGTVRGALYTSVPWIGGTTNLVLRWFDRPKGPSSEVICGLLLWVIADLQAGLLAVGGETAIGRGTFAAFDKSVVSGEILINGHPLTDPNSYSRVAAEWIKAAKREEV
ncbi:MAG: hypothetical protein K6T85_05880 [Gorillibacterium sp.]|nr:hypothetical protein [Gorillibacterium sp.]